MMLKTLVAASVVAGAVAFAPAGLSQVNGVVQRQATSVKMGYVPDGLTEAEYKKQQEEAKAKREANKKRFAGKKIEDLTDWLLARDAKYPNQPGAGHTFAKVKYPEAGIPAKGPPGVKTGDKRSFK